MQIVLDFVTGKVGMEEFKKAWYSDPSIGEWLDGLVNFKADLKPEWKEFPTLYYTYLGVIKETHNGSVLAFINASEKYDKLVSEKGHVSPKWIEVLWYFEVIAAVVKAAYPEIIPTPYYRQESDFLLAVVGDYLGGDEVEDFISDLLDKYPPEMPKTKRKKEAKAALREAFHLEGSKYPMWAQEPEWPMGKKSPMAYVSKKTDGDLVRFTFRDVDTGEEKIVEQLY